MVDPQLVSYVREQLNAGYTQEQIRYVLEQQGYPDSLIQAAFQATNTNSRHDKTLLKSYVNNAKSQGFSDYDIEQELSNQGYSEKNIHKALAPKEHHTKTLLLFPLLAILVLAVGYFFISTDVTPNQPDVSIDTPLRYGDVSRQVLDMASSNPQGAVGICESLIERDRQRCISAVIVANPSPSFCESIPYDGLRDTCYLQLIYKGNTEFCSELVLSENIRLCRAVMPNSFGQA